MKAKRSEKAEVAIFTLCATCWIITCKVSLPVKEIGLHVEPLIKRWLLCCTQRQAPESFLQPPLSKACSSLMKNLLHYLEKSLHLYIIEIKMLCISWIQLIVLYSRQGRGITYNCILHADRVCTEFCYFLFFMGSLESPPAPRDTTLPGMHESGLTKQSWFESFYWNPFPRLGECLLGWLQLHLEHRSFSYVPASEFLRKNYWGSWPFLSQLVFSAIKQHSCVHICICITLSPNKNVNT